MSHSLLPMQPHEATKLLLANLASRRMRDVIEKRFGLKGGRRHTLESIGKEYKITRERVRQIEFDALKNLKKEDHLMQVKPLFQSLEAHLQGNGGAMAEHHLFSDLCEARYHPHLSLLLSVGKSFHRFPESDNFHPRVAVSKEAAEKAEKVVNATIGDLEERGQPVSGEELEATIRKNAKETFGEVSGASVFPVYLGLSRLVRKNPYGEFGLISWATINPRGMRDKAYVVLAKSGKPMHFREVASAIDKTGWSKRKAHPQTVHNELIKDNRFVLVGRGLYALKEWGYEPGIVRDVLASVLKRAGKPLSKEAIIQLVSEKRFVKPQTIILNLQNRSLFRRTNEGKYTLT